MKKYVKPDLFYEDFKLSQSVAACSVDEIDGFTYTHTDRYTCAVMFDDYQIPFANDCPGSLFEEYCYQTGSDSLTFFTS